MGKSDDSRSPSPAPAKHSRYSDAPDSQSKRPKLDSEPSETEVYVGNLSWDASEADIEDHFASCGAIKHIKLLTNEEGRSRGSAFVHFEEKEAAEKALKMDGEEMMGRRLKVNRAGERTQQKGAGETNTVYVGNLAYTTTEEDIEEFLRDCGRVKSVRIARDFEGRMKGFAHVEFEEDSAVERAMKKNGEELLGRSLKINYAVRKEGGGGRGRGPSRFSRSRYQGSGSHY